MQRKMQPIDTIDMSILQESLARQTDNFILESRMTPAIIYMKRGTVIPVHHYRKIRTPIGGVDLVVAGIEPISRREEHNALSKLIPKLRDFYSLPSWEAIPWLVESGVQDEMGWSEPYDIDEDGSGGRYNAKRVCVMCRKFLKILTISAENIERIEPVQHIEDYRWGEDDDPNMGRADRFRE